MTRLSVFLIAVSVLFVVVPSLASQAPFPALLAAVVAGGWIWTSMRSEAPRIHHHVFLGSLVLLNLIAASTGSWLHPVLSVSAALYAWDVTITAQHLKACPHRPVDRFAARYAVNIVVFGGIGVLLATAAAWIRFPLSPWATVALTFSCLLIAGVVLRQLRNRSSA